MWSKLVGQSCYQPKLNDLTLHREPKVILLYGATSVLSRVFHCFVKGMFYRASQPPEHWTLLRYRVDRRPELPI